MTPQTAEPGMPARHQRLMRFLPLAVMLVVLLTALPVFSDLSDLASAFRAFDWWLIVPVLLLTTWNYAWRFVKWQMYLRELGIQLPWKISLRVFLAGFSMSVTPGKVGELLKAVYLRRLSGAPVSQTSAAIAAERLTDGLAMFVLAGAGAIEFAYGRSLLFLGAVLALGAVALLQRPGLLNRQVERLARFPVVGRAAVHGTMFVSASGTLFRPAILLRAVMLGLISWTGECVAFFLILTGLGLDGSLRLLLIATFILAVTSIAGGASMLPGGLGVADAGIAALLVLLVDERAGMSNAIAAAATLLIRFSTLWFAVAIGALAVVSLERHSRSRQQRAEPEESVQSAPGMHQRPDEGRESASSGRVPVGDGGEP
ncbi:MAG: TIGR00374 family protein [Thermomicrobiales bacterium]|nr:MAG: TIGR00374 family protein [Thermomicrobiales bacterium]